MYRRQIIVIKIKGKKLNGEKANIENEPNKNGIRYF